MVKKWLGYSMAGIALLALAIIGVGYALPQNHTATVRAHYHQPAESLYHAIIDVAAGPSWRGGLDSVQMLAREPLTWREHSSFGKLTMVIDEATPPSRIVSRIADVSEGFGGTWTYEIATSAKGSVVTITERGEVYSPLFRFMSRFVFGHYGTLESYAQDLGKRFNEIVEPERVGH